MVYIIGKFGAVSDFQIKMCQYFCDIHSYIVAWHHSVHHHNIIHSTHSPSSPDTLQAYFRYRQHLTTLCEPMSWTRGAVMPHLCHASWPSTVRTASVFSADMSFHKKSSSWKISGGGKVCRERFRVRRRI